MVFFVLVCLFCFHALCFCDEDIRTEVGGECKRIIDLYLRLEPYLAVDNTFLLLQWLGMFSEDFLC